MGEIREVLGGVEGWELYSDYIVWVKKLCLIKGTKRKKMKKFRRGSS